MPSRALVRSWLDDLKRPRIVPFSAAFAVCWLIRLLRRYPPHYLLVPDIEILVAQIASWISILGQTSFVWAGSQLALMGLSRIATQTSNRAPLLRRWSERTGQFLEHPWKPLIIVFLATAAVNLAAWHSLSPRGTYPDDAAYLLQARILASGHWTSAGAPIPKFFEQLYVFVTPFTAAKYPPGFSLSLVPGALLGLPGLMPLLFLSVAGVLLFDWARRETGVWVAAVGCVLWITFPYEWSGFSAFDSEALTVMLVVLGWWSLSRWLETRRFGYLLALTISTCWGGITRPATMVAFVIPIAVVLAIDAVRNRALGRIFSAAAMGALVLLIIPLWSTETLGTWRTTPLQEYARRYMPFESYGSRLSGRTAGSQQILSPAIQRHVKSMEEGADHLARSSWTELEARLFSVHRDLAGRSRGWLLPFALAGLFVCPRKLWVAISFVPLLLALYLPHPQPATLIIYYVETYPVIFLLMAIGVCGLAAAATGQRFSSSDRTADATHPWVGPALIVILVAFGFTNVQLRASITEAAQAPYRRFRDRLREIPDKKALVFVRFDPNYEVPPLLVENVPDRDQSRILLAHDRGLENPELMRVYPDRTPYLYRAAEDRLERLTPPPN